MERLSPACQEDILRLKALNRALLEEDITEKRKILRAHPTFIGLGTDTRCNLRCIICIHRLYDYQQLVNNPPIEEALLIKFAEQTFPTADVVELNAAGEPFMSRHIDLEIELAELYGVGIQVVTNGTLINAKKGRLEKLLNNALSVQVSIDSPDKKRFTAIRPGADLDQVIENLRLLQKIRNNISTKKRPSFSINMALMRSTLRDLPAMVMFTKNIGADHLEICRLVVFTKEMEAESLAHCKSEYNQTILDAKKLAESVNLSITIPPLYAVAPEVKKKERVACNSHNKSVTEMTKHCLFLWKRTYLFLNGDLLSCGAPQHPITGNIEKSDFLEIWNGQKYQEMRSVFSEGFTNHPCFDCATTGFLSSSNF